MGDPFGHRTLEVPNTFGSGSRNGRRHRRREDKARRRGTDRVANDGIGRNVAADDTEPFGKGSFNDVDSVHGPIALGYARTAPAVETDGMNLIEISKRTVFLCEIADPSDRSDIAVHRVE